MGTPTQEALNGYNVTAPLYTAAELRRPGTNQDLPQEAGAPPHSSRWASPVAVGIHGGNLQVQV